MNGTAGSQRLIEADYIVVGAGTAGCVVARRLSESGRFSVLLLEAGGTDRSPWLRIPIGYGRSFFNPAVNWMYRTEPDPGLDGRSGYWPRGKVLGGSGAINAMVFVRGHPADFDDWAEMGCPGWGWRNVLPYFKRLESFERGANDWRGGNGPLHVRDVASDIHPICDAFFAAAGALGFPRNGDYNGATLDGVAPYQITTRDGWRETTARAYLARRPKAANVRIETGALATRLVFEGTRARGIEFQQHGGTVMAHAHREVILACGAINTPVLLQRSGVGPAAHLRDLGIDIVRDQPAVGAHLQDHLCIDYIYRATVPTLNQELGTWRGRIGAGLRYLWERRGPLSLSVNQAGGFVRSRPELARPDLQLYFSPLSYTRTLAGTRPLMRPDVFPGFLLSAQPCRPRSRGEVRARSADPLAAPVIVPNALNDSEDLDDLVTGAELLRKLAATDPLRRVIAAELQPGPAVSTREEIIADIRRRASTVFHPVGTCRMGSDPRSSVVDPRLVAHGLQSLRIIDASVFPALTSGNTNAPTIMVAEKGAELVLADAHTT